jgi:hypothetical protein
MDQHVHVIGILWIILGVLGLCFGLFVLLLLLGISFLPSIGAEAPDILRIVAYVAGAFFALLGVPRIIAGVGLLKKREWARILTIVLSFFELWNVPFGLALAIYSLVILFKPETIALFNAASARPSA